MVARCVLLPVDPLHSHPTRSLLEVSSVSYCARVCETGMVSLIIRMMPRLLYPVDGH